MPSSASVDVLVSEMSASITIAEEEGPEVTLSLPPLVAQVTVSVPGPAGPMGPPGELVEGTGDLNYAHIQGVPSRDWSILHGLGKYPSVTIVDSSGSEVIGDVEHVNEDLSLAHFSSPFSGTAYAN